MAESEITRLLGRASDGDEQAFAEVADWAYSELERLAAIRLRKRYGGQLAGVTLEPAAVVNETFLKLLGSPVGFENRRHFLAFASRVMLRVLIDYDRARSAEKRGGAAIRVTLSSVGKGRAADAFEIAAVAQALHKLGELSPRKASVAELRLLWGFENAEIARTLEVSVPTVERDWRFARSWLRAELEESRGGAEPETGVPADREEDESR